VDSIPTQIFFGPEGKELWRHVGFLAKDDILAKWREFGHDFTGAALIPGDIAGEGNGQAEQESALPPSPTCGSCSGE